MTSASQILESFWNIILESLASQRKKPFSDVPTHGPGMYTFTIVRDTRSGCGGPLTWKAQIHDGSHRVNFDCNLPSSCFAVQYNSLILLI